MNTNSKKRAGFGWKIIGGLAVAAGVGYLYKQSQEEDIVPLPKAIETDLEQFHSSVAGELFYYVDRRQSGRPLLLLHSINAAPSSMEVRPLFDHYRQERPVYSLELPGFGFSERSEHQAYVPALYTQAIIEMVSTQIGTAVDAIALSLTSEFVAQAALQRPDLFNSLTLVSPTGFQAGQAEKEYPEERLYKFFSFPGFSQALYSLLTKRSVIKYYLDQSFLGTAAPELAAYAYATSHQPKARFAPLYFLSTQLFTWDILPAVYEKLSTPVLVLYDEDPNVTFENLQSLVDTRPNWQATRLAPSRGLPHWEMLSQVAVVLAQFWEAAN